MNMTKHYISLVESLEYAVNDRDDFIEGNGTPINFDELLEPFEHDNIVQSLLLVIILAVIKLCK